VGTPARREQLNGKRIAELTPQLQSGGIMVGSSWRVNLGLFAAVTVIASGCASMRPYDPGPGNRVAAIVPQDTYLSGESVNVTISNLSEVTLYYPDGFCKTALQRRTGEDWMTIPNPSSGCPVTVGFLDPGQSVVHQYHVPKGLAAGIYRLTIPMPVPEEATAPEPELLSPTFRVASAQGR
jgi:hypothetical protein